MVAVAPPPDIAAPHRPDIRPAIGQVVERLRAALAGNPQTAADPRANPAWLDEHRAARPDATSTRSPVPGLDPADVLLLAAAGLIEQDVRFGALFAHLQDPLPYRRPCVGLLGWLLADPDLPPDELVRRAQGLVGRGLLEVENPADPRPEWVPRLPGPVWDLLHGGRLNPEALPDGLSRRPARSFPAVADLVLDAGAARIAARLPALLRDGAVRGLIVRGMTGSGRTTLLGALAAALGLDLLVHEGPAGGPAWRLFGALASIDAVLPVVRVAPTPGETVELPRLPGVDRPVGVVLGRTGSAGGPLLEPALTVALGDCAPADRRRLWSGLGVAGPDPGLTDRFLLTPGAIHRVAPVATAAARAAGRTAVTSADLATAARTLHRGGLETLATLLEPTPRDSSPVLTDTAREEFETLLLRCRQRERLPGLAGHTGLNRGVRALFSGPSGTGKTLAARHLGRLLGLDVFRVNLSSVVSKYLGETERNLDRLLSRAEEANVLLLLDEGDALLTRRTDVGDAHDRYANMETNFLLQRLETFEGIVVVTSNAADRIDQAFQRRIEVTVDFVRPDAELRHRLWCAHLPAGHDVDPAVLAQVARRCDLTGGQIRNATLHAVLRGVDDGRAPGTGDVLAAVRREYRRAGAACPLPADLGGAR